MMMLTSMHVKMKMMPLKTMCHEDVTAANDDDNDDDDDDDEVNGVSILTPPAPLPTSLIFL